MKLRLVVPERRGAAVAIRSCDLWRCWRTGPKVVEYPGQGLLARRANPWPGPLSALGPQVEATEQDVLHYFA